MSEPLPSLRSDLDFMPSPAEDRPGLLIRDSFRYSDAMLIIPPALVPCLSCFDGEQTTSDLRAMLVQVTGELRVSEIEEQLVKTLSGAGFLRDGNYRRLKDEARTAFAQAAVREPAHAGSGYPDDPADLRTATAEWLGSATPTTSGLIGIAAPHVSPVGGYKSYGAAYRQLGPEYKDRTFVVLGTSHYGAPEKFGLTRKPYLTPYGASQTDTTLVEQLTTGAPDAVTTEDYCHAVEHSIEFQIVFLQSIFGPDIKILPILCGSYAKSLLGGGKPEDDEGVKRFLGTLGEIAERERDRLFWVLGIDMAHMGRRYGDEFEALADQNEMVDVAAHDLERIEKISSGDARGFWELIQDNQDPLKWCGSSPLYTFMKVCPHARGSLDRYEQWNIDPQSVVSFAGMRFV